MKNGWGWTGAEATTGNPGTPEAMQWIKSNWHWSRCLIAALRPSTALATSDACDAPSLVTSVVERVLPLDRAAEAHAYMAGGEGLLQCRVVKWRNCGRRIG